MNPSLLAALFVLAFATSVAAQTTWYVDDDNMMNTEGGGYGEDSGDYGKQVAERTECDLDCAPDSIPEGEPTCHDDYVDTFNTGCHGMPPVFQPMSCEDRICGESGTFLLDGSDYRDTDWYELVLTEQTNSIIWTVEAEFDVLILLIDANQGGCSNLVVLDDASALPCETATVSAQVGPGTYWLWVGPSVFDGVPCGSIYNSELTCGRSPFPVPAVSHWGLVTMMLLVLTAGTLAFVRRGTDKYDALTKR